MSTRLQHQPPAFRCGSTAVGWTRSHGADSLPCCTSSAAERVLIWYRTAGLRLKLGYESSSIKRGDGICRQKAPPSSSRRSRISQQAFTRARFVAPVRTALVDLAYSVRVGLPRIPIPTLPTLSKLWPNQTLSGIIGLRPEARLDPVTCPEPS